MQLSCIGTSDPKLNAMRGEPQINHLKRVVVTIITSVRKKPASNTDPHLLQQVILSPVPSGPNEGHEGRRPTPKRACEPVSCDSQASIYISFTEDLRGSTPELQPERTSRHGGAEAQDTS